MIKFFRKDPMQTYLKAKKEFESHDEICKRMNSLSDQQMNRWNKLKIAYQDAKSKVFSTNSDTNIVELKHDKKTI